MISLLSDLRSFRGNIKKFKKGCSSFHLPERPWRYFKEWRQSLKPRCNPLADRMPWITMPALHWLQQMVKPWWQIFEYGMGGSTLFWLERGCVVYSVEHHPEWFCKVRDLSGKSPHLHAFLSQPTTEKGDPFYESHFGQWDGLNFEDYVRKAEQIPPLSVDLALVDGRARIACIAAIMPAVKSGGYLLFDNSERARYLPGLQRLEKEGWIATHFAGPGYYEKGKFWVTSLYKKPD